MELRYLLNDLRLEGQVSRLDGKVNKTVEVAYTALKTTPKGDLFIEPGEAAHCGLGGSGVVPQAGFGSLFLQLLYFQFFALDVKDGPEGMRSWLGAVLPLVLVLPFRSLPRALYPKGEGNLLQPNFITDLQVRTALSYLPQRGGPVWLAQEYGIYRRTRGRCAGQTPGRPCALWTRKWVWSRLEF